MRLMGVVALIAAGCAQPDVCAGVSRACIAVEVRGASLLDQLAVSSAELGLDGARTPADARAVPVRPPIQFALVPRADFTGPYSLTVRAQLNGLVVAAGPGAGLVNANQHQSIVVELQGLVGADLGGIDFAVARDDGGHALDLASGDLASGDLAGATDDAASGAVPQLISPLSSSTVMKSTPTLTWKNPAGPVHIDICADRACSAGNVIDHFEVAGSQGASTMTFDTPGWRYWRARYVAGGPFTPTWQFWVRGSSTPRDRSFGTVLDLNGDGHADFVVGGSNKAFVFVTLAGGTPATTPITLDAPAGASGFGSAVAPAGDVDGDGFADLIVGAPGSNNAYVFYGGSDGVSASRFTKLTGDASSSFGTAVSSAGDVDGDGFADVIVGACSIGGNCGEHARVFRGGAGGVIANVVATQLDAPVTGKAFASALASAGDVNGDGFGDVIVGAEFANTVWLYHGSAGGLSKTVHSPAIVGTGTATTPTFGSALALAGDVNGDGFADVIVGDWSSQIATVYTGGANGVTGASGTTAPLLVPASTGSFGFAVSGGSDLNGDGRDDVVVSDNQKNNVFVYTDLSSLPPNPLSTAQPFGSFGRSVAVIGDCGSDALSELVIGAAGSVFVFAGNASHISTLIGQPQLTASGFGLPVAMLLRRR